MLLNSSTHTRRLQPRETGAKDTSPPSFVTLFSIAAIETYALFHQHHLLQYTLCSAHCCTSSVIIFSHRRKAVSSAVTICCCSEHFETMHSRRRDKGSRKSEKTVPHRTLGAHICSANPAFFFISQTVSHVSRIVLDDFVCENFKELVRRKETVSTVACMASRKLNPPKPHNTHTHARLLKSAPCGVLLQRACITHCSQPAYSYCTSRVPHDRAYGW